nr:MAG TPA: hypothetical protein [Caudoviricetes sp.]
MYFNFWENVMVSPPLQLFLTFHKFSHILFIQDAGTSEYERKELLL